jgi:hypothetical protein
LKGRTAVCWTNGSIGCFVITTAGKPAEDFEKGAAF